MIKKKKRAPEHQEAFLVRSNFEPEFHSQLTTKCEIWYKIEV